MRYLRSLQLNMERGCKANVEISPTCPRCGSCNTKFCYYNNYSLTQPRYFCKGCRRYWTKGGCLRNIPVGGGCQKTRRGKSIRLSTDIMSSRRGPMNDLLGLSHGSTSSSTMPPNVDLALVYANFLNPQPHSSNTGSGSEPQEPTRSASNNGLSMDPSISSGMTNGPDSSISLLEAGNGFPEWESLSDPFVDTHHLSKYENPNNPTIAFDHLMFESSLQADLHGKAIQQCGIEDTKCFVPRPLPSEDVLSEETPASWSSTHHMLVDDHSLQALELPVVRPDHQGQTKDPNLLTGANYREFDFPAGEKEVRRCVVPMRVHAHTNT